MKYIIQTLVALISLIFFNACESSSATYGGQTDKNITISGKVVDGYISNAIVYLDLNSNDSWDNNEPKVTTSQNGAFSFDSVSLETDSFIPVTSIGGVDTTTNKTFEGRLKNIIDTSSLSETTTLALNITPLTDLITALFLELTTKDSTILQNTKTNIAKAYSISEEDVEKSPMLYAGIFAKSQEIQQTKILIGTSAKKAKNKTLTNSETELLLNEIKKAIVIGINTNQLVDISSIITEVEKNLEIIIPDNEETFIVAQLAEVKSELDSFRMEENLTQTNLNDFQLALETEQEKAFAKIESAQESDVLDVITINIDVLSKTDTNTTVPDTNTTVPDTNTTVPDTNTTVPDTNTTVPDTNTTVPDTNTTEPDNEPDETMTEISFNGTVVDGYISGASVCLDIDNSGICSIDEPTVVTSESGKFSFNSVEVKKSTQIPIIVSGGVDIATKKQFEREFNSVIDSSLVTQETQLMITPITDLASILFLQDKVSIEDSIKAIADGLGLTSEEMFIDPMKDVNVFSKSQEIEHIKSLIGVVSIAQYDENLTTMQEQDVYNNIKEVLISRIIQTSALDIDEIIRRVEIELSIVIPESEKSFVKAQITEIRRVLDDITVVTWALDRLQYTMNLVLEKAYSTLESVDINITDEAITKSPFSKTDAIFDKSACIINSENNNTIKDSNGSINRVDDTVNGISLDSSYNSGSSTEENEVKIFYSDLDTSKSNDNVVIEKDNYYFSFDDAWITNSPNTIYIQTPKETDNLYRCYRVKLNSTVESDISFTKVYSYSDIVDEYFVESNTSDINTSNVE